MPKDPGGGALFRMFGDEGSLLIGGRVAAELVQWTLERASAREPWALHATMGKRSDYLLGYVTMGRGTVLRLQLRGNAWVWSGVGVEVLGENTVLVSGTERPEVQDG